MDSTNTELPRLVDNCKIGDNTEISEFSAVKDCSIGSDTRIWRFVNMYGATVGNNSMIGSFVEIQEDTEIGNRCRIQTHAFVCSLVTIEDDVFVSHGAKFINDLRPPSGDRDEWEPTIVKEGASIGTNATLLPVTVGENALVGAGAVVVDDVPPSAVVVGNPAEVVEYRDEE